MKAGLIGGSSQQFSLPFNAERSINCYTVINKEGKEPAALYGTAGYDLFATVSTGPIRGMFTAAADGRTFVVSTDGLYELMSNGTSTLRGTIATSSSIVIMEENGIQLGISDGSKLYMFTYATNAFALVVSSLPASVGTLTFVGGYFIMNQNATGKFFISNLYDGLTWQALKFATAESSPDNLLRVQNVLGQLWLFGSLKSEVWNNNGAAAFPFAKISGSEMQQGIVGAHAMSVIDNTAVWVGTDKNGSYIVYRATGFTPQRISTEAIELLLRKATSPSTIRMWNYQENGHTFLIITGGGLETSPCLDLSTGLWHERAFFNANGFFEIHRGACNVQAFSKNLLGDKQNGSIYRMSQDIYADNASPLVMDRIFTHLSEENQPFRNANLTVVFETGVGLQSGQGSDPLAQLSLSNDGGRTWFGSQLKQIGVVGNFLRGVVFQRLGMARVRTFRLRVTDPVKRCITGAYFNVDR